MLGNAGLRRLVEDAPHFADVDQREAELLGDGAALRYAGTMLTTASQLEGGYGIDLADRGRELRHEGSGRRVQDGGVVLHEFRDGVHHVGLVSLCIVHMSCFGLWF